MGILKKSEYPAHGHLPSRPDLDILSHPPGHLASEVPPGVVVYRENLDVAVSGKSLHSPNIAGSEIQGGRNSRMTQAVRTNFQPHLVANRSDNAVYAGTRKTLSLPCSIKIDEQRTGI